MTYSMSIVPSRNFRMVFTAAIQPVYTAADPVNNKPECSCPFAADLCLLGNTSAYEMHTGPIDSHIALGLNAPVADQITSRKVTTCSPIKTHGYGSEYKDTNAGTLTYGDTFDRLY